MAEPDRRRFAEQLLAFALQSDEYAFVLLDRDARIVFWNAQAQRVFGYEEREILGEPLSRLFVVEDLARRLDRHEVEIARNDGSAEDDRWQQRKDGSRVWVAGTLSAIRDDAGKVIGYCKLMRERTAQREQMQSLRNRLSVLDQAAQRKDVFLATLSHELRNPLAPLVNAVQLLRMALPQPDAHVQSAVGIIERQIQTLRRLVDDLLEFSRIGVGRIELRRETLVLHGLVARAVESVQPLVDARRHQLDVLLPEVPIEFPGDGDRLVQVVTNLLNNAAKYTPEGGRIVVKGTVEVDEVVLRVVDNGMGIPHDVLPRIFDLFTRTDSARLHAREGLGIGLSLVRDLVAAHGGSVQVQSDGPNCGSTFTVRLPLGPTQ
jgi:PAS domain S-box-containing protein